MMLNISRLVTEPMKRPATCGLPVARDLSTNDSETAAFPKRVPKGTHVLISSCMLRSMSTMQELINTWVPFGTRLGKAAVSESLVERSLATGKPQVAGLFIGAVTKRLMFSIIVPVQIDGENRYVLGRSQDQHAIARLVAASELPTGW